MGIEGGSNSEVQNQEINQANNEQNEINQAEHQRSGEELEGNSTIDNEGERKQIEGKDDATESAEDESSQLDKEDNIEDDPNTEQPPESDNVAPEQQLDNQDTIESDPSGADEMGEDNNETVDSLDNDDEIEDAEDLDDTPLQLYYEKRIQQTTKNVKFQQKIQNINLIYFTSLTDFTFPLGLVLNSRAWLFASGIE